jgi:hypothetical protein
MVNPSLVFMHEGIRNLFTSIDGGDDDEQGSACDYEAELAIAYVALVVWSGVSSLLLWLHGQVLTSQGFFDLVED